MMSFMSHRPSGSFHGLLSHAVYIEGPDCKPHSTLLDTKPIQVVVSLPPLHLKIQKPTHYLLSLRMAAADSFGQTRSESSTSSTPPHKSAENQKNVRMWPTPWSTSTDWMLSPETLASRPAKDVKFAHLVSLGLAKGRTKAGWAQARRPGKRDRDAAKKKLTEELTYRVAEVEMEMQAGGGNGANTDVTVEEIVEDTKRMAISGACACVGATTGAA